MIPSIPAGIADRTQALGRADAVLTASFLDLRDFFTDDA